MLFYSFCTIDVRGIKREQTAACTLKQSLRVNTRTNSRLIVFWRLFVMFAESQIEASERDPGYCKNGCEMLFLGNL